jgi:ribosome-associated heat shock protein Hsp15
MEEGVRIDKWLWAVRIFKTRSQATLACKSGKVKINDCNVKPSREVKIDEIISVSLSSFQKKVRVTGLLINRVSAKLVENYSEDLTPKEEYEKQKLKREVNFEFRQRGIGRPTKKERREIEILKKYLGD